MGSLAILVDFRPSIQSFTQYYITPDFIRILSNE